VIESKYKSTPFLKKLLWLYFLLLLFEGALRKWVFPGLATPLLIIRDPLAVWLIIVSWRKGILEINIYVTLMMLIGVFATFTAILLGHGNLFVALYGARIFLIHFPLLFVIGKLFDKEDVERIGAFMLWVSIPMTFLLIVQFYSPQSAYVNRGVGGDLNGSGFSGALGYYRASTTFSFSTGTVAFYHLLGCYICYFWLSPSKRIPKYILVFTSILLVLAVPLSISRTLFFSVILLLIFTIFAVAVNKGSILKIIGVAVVLFVIIMLVSQLEVFQTATNVFTTRFTDANQVEGGVQSVLADRYLGGLVSALLAPDELPFFGYGLGMGTNVGSVLMSGKIEFLISEGEWGRLVGELGFSIGIIVIIVRLIVSVKITIASWHDLKYGNTLPWILLCFCLLTLPQGQWAQPTSLGFSIFVAGLTISSLRSTKGSS